MNASKIAPVNTHSLASKFSDHEKQLSECVWEVLLERKLINVEKKQPFPSCISKIATEVKITGEQFQSFLEHNEGSCAIVECYVSQIIAKK